MFTGGMAQGISAGIDSNRDWAERQQLMQIKKLAIGKAMREEENHQDATPSTLKFCNAGGTTYYDSPPRSRSNFTPCTLHESLII